MTTVYINPLYKDVVSVDEFRDVPLTLHASTSFSERQYVADESVVIDTIRQAMVQREQQVVVYYETTEQLGQEFLGEWLDSAVEETGEPDEGDYLRWHYGGAKANTSYLTYSDGRKEYTITINFSYYTTAEQEIELSNAIDTLITELKITDQLSDYQKVKKIYDYMCSNITYDYDNLNDDTHKLKYTAYAALIHKTAVCQGYASLLYRVLKEVDVDTRIIAGIGNGGPHGWNIIKLENLYYCADATWDAGRTEYNYFLKTSANFDDHTSYDEYTTNEFQSAYPMAQSDYVPPTTVISGSCGKNVTYILYSNGTLMIEGTGEMESYAESQGKGSPWYNYRYDFTNVVIGSGVTSIGDYAFGAGGYLKTISIPEGVTSIGQYALTYAYCKELRLPNTLTYIGEGAFAYNDFESIYIPKSVETIVASTHTKSPFYKCENLAMIFCEADEKPVDWGKGWESGGNTNLDTTVNFGYDYDEYLFWANLDKTATSVSVPQGYTKIPGNAFRKFSNLSRVYLPEGITEVGDYGFYYCSSLTEINLPESVTNIGYKCFYECSSLKEIDLPEKLTDIEKYAFAYCESLRSVDIPKGITMINESTFAECTGLKKVSMSDNVQAIANEAFYNCLELEELYLSDGLISLGQNVFEKCKGLRNVYIPESLTQIDAQTSNTAPFGVCSNKLCLYVKEQKNYTNGTYWNYSSNTSTYTTYYGYTRADFEGEMTSYMQIYGSDTFVGGKCGDKVFWAINHSGDFTIFGTGRMYAYDTENDVMPWLEHMPSIKNVIVQDGVQNVGSYAFWNASNLKTVSLPDSVTTVGEHSFFKCHSLETINITSNITGIGSSAFHSCYLIESADISGVQRISDGIFQGCTSLRDVTISDTIYTIGAYAFSGTDIEKFNFPETVTSIGRDAFRFTRLKQVILPPKITIVEEIAFGNCDELTYVYIPASVKTIDELAFHDNPKLVCVEIEEGNLTKINGSAFSWDSKLTYINIPDSVTEIDDSAFYSNMSNKPVSESLVFAIDTNTVASLYAVEHGISCKKICSNHDIEIRTMEQGCEQDGKLSIVCVNCDEIYGEVTTEELESTGHEWNIEFTVDKEATCTEKGSKSKHCLGCTAKSEITEIPAKGHKWNIEFTIEKEATCTEKGSKLRHCLECTEKSEITEIPARGHKWGEWTVVIEPTNQNNGLEKQVCSSCKEELTRDIPKLEYVAGWQQNNVGWWYQNANGSYPAACWQQINGTWYYFNSSGYMVTGWQQLGGSWYYFATSGAMVTGWQSIGGIWYYFAGSGAMVTGWQAIGGTWYYFNGSGAMVTGWQAIGGTWYYFEGSGAMVANKWIGNYYLQADGSMATNKWIGIYYVGFDGCWIP